MTTTIYEDALADARNMSTDALLATIDILTINAHEPDMSDTYDTFRLIAQERLNAFNREWHRRQRLSRMSEAKRAAYDQTHQEWLDLARSVREMITVPEVLHLIGYPATRKGKEYHGACPVCRDGTDRLVSWDNPNSRCWCRQCGWKADVIAVTQSFMPGCSHFRDAVRTLANLSSLTEVPR